MYSSNTKCAEVADKSKCLKGLTAEEIVKAWIPFQDVYPAWNADEITDLPIRNERFGNLAIVDGKNEMVTNTRLQGARFSGWIYVRTYPG